MTARNMRRCPHGRVFEWDEIESFAEVRCDAPGCTVVVTDRFGWTNGGSIGVPPGWVRITTEARELESERKGFADAFALERAQAVTQRDYCPAHVPDAIAAATRGA